MKFQKLLTLFCLCAFLYCCSENKTEQQATEIVSDTTSSLPVYKIPDPDSLFILNVVRQHNVHSDIETEVLNFYTKRNFHCAWFNENGLTEQAGKVVNMVRDYLQSGIVDTSMFLPGVRDLYAAVSDENFTPANNDTLVMNADVSFTIQFLSFSKLAWRGIGSDRVKKLDWFLPVKKLADTEYLTEVLSPEKEFISGSEPVFKQYLLLKEKLKLYRTILNNGGWNVIESTASTLKVNDESEIIRETKIRLTISGEYAGDTTSTKFDSGFAEVIVSARKQFGLSEDTVIDNKLIVELNVGVDQRIRQMLLNLERWKWIPADPGKNFIAVNIPEFMLHVFENNKVIKSMKVIVGKEATQTVIFTSDLKYVVLSPHWVIPRSILIKETIPAIRKNNNYLAQHQMEIVTNTSSPKVISPSSIDWKNISPSSFPYVIRQKPGPSNALGYVKFLFPNEYSIYLHDTPSRNLFSREGRMFSHGCIRIAEPKWLAGYLLKNDTAWSNEKIDAAMHSGNEKYVTLKENIPVYITYFTSWVDSNGRLNFRKDVYGHDRKLEREIFLNKN